MKLCLIFLFAGAAFAAPIDEGGPLPEPTPSPGDDDGNATEVGISLEGTQVADLAFLVDVTGSMSSYIQGVKEAIDRIVENANKKEISLRLAFIGYRDPFVQQPPSSWDGDAESFWRSPKIEAAEFDILPFTKRLRDFKSFMESVQARGGGDLPEDVFGGLEKAGQLEWSPAANRRLLFHIADVPGHGVQFGGSGNHNQGDPLKRKLSKLLGDLQEADVEYVFGKVNDGTQTMLAEFGKVWDGKIKQFTVTAPRRHVFPGAISPAGFAAGGGGGFAASLGGPHPPPPPMAPMALGASSRASAGAAGDYDAAEAEESVADKVASAIDSLLE